MRLPFKLASHYQPLRGGLAAVLILAIAAGCGIRNRSEEPTAPPEPPPAEEPVANPPNPADDTDPAPVDSAEVSPPVRPAPSSSNLPGCETAQTQAEMTRCAQERYEQVDARLNQLVEQVRTQLSEDDRSRFGQAEQAWIDYRRQNCDFESSLFSGGSIEPMIYYSCMERMTGDRIATLQNQP